jgi:putative transposase
MLKTADDALPIPIQLYTPYRLYKFTSLVQIQVQSYLKTKKKKQKKEEKDIAKKTYHCRVIQDLTKVKLEALEQEHNNLQTKEDRGLHSANKQQADRFYKIIKKTIKYPISIRNDQIKIEHNPNSMAEYWVRIRVKAVKGGIWIGLIKPYEPIPKDAKICECKLYKRDCRWWLDVVVQRKIPEHSYYQDILAIDLGIKHVVTSVMLSSGATKFYGKALTQVKCWYQWLRKRLGKKKALKTIKKIGNKESRIIDDMIHKITREIVDYAVEHNCLIVVGDLKGLRNQDKKRMSKKFNRKVAGFPYFKVTQQLVYKAALAGIKTIVVGEAYTSQECFKCTNRDKKARKTQGLYLCRNNDCNKEENADRNAAFNIARKALGYISKAGVSVNSPNFSRTHHIVNPIMVREASSREAIGFNR